MTEYSAFVALVARLIKKKGRSGVSLFRSQPGTATNGATPWKLDVTPPADLLLASGLNVLFLDQRQVRGEQGQFGVEVSFRSRLNMPDSLVPGATAVAYFIPQQLGVSVPAAGDLVLSGITRYSVMRCDALKPGDELIMYYAQLAE
jgi:hypothetical protein